MGEGPGSSDLAPLSATRVREDRGPWQGLTMNLTAKSHSACKHRQIECDGSDVLRSLARYERLDAADSKSLRCLHAFDRCFLFPK